MKTLVLALLFSASVYAQTQPLRFYIDTSNGALPTSQLSPLSPTYQFPDTPVGGSSSVVIRAVNVSSAAVQARTVYVGASAESAVATPNFTLTGWVLNATIAPQAWQLFTINFTPTALAGATGYLQASVNGSTVGISTVEGNGTIPGLTLTCTNVSAPQAVPQCNGTCRPAKYHRGPSISEMSRRQRVPSFNSL